MKRMHHLKYKLVLALGIASTLAFGQKHSKDFKESFKVGSEAVVELNTSHADIAFETWNRNEIVVEATIVLEGATEEEAERFFKNPGLEIVGNSQGVEVKTGSAHFSFNGVPAPHFQQPFIVDIPDMPDLEPIFAELHIPELPPMPDLPPMPPVPMEDFDYEAFKKDGEKYMKQWKEEFDKKFDKEYVKQMEEWSEAIQEREKERIKMKEELHEQRNKFRQEHQELRQEAQKERREHMEKAREAQREAMDEHRKLVREHRNVIVNSKKAGDAPHVFYWSSDGQNKNFKIKKTIRIKMPKSARLKMNVRHGEVTLAENTNNMEATLSHARLLASTIDGDRTRIIARYSPVQVNNWNLGSLKADFSEAVNLRQVRNLELKANSSEITIDELLGGASIVNSLGDLHINSVGQSFNNLSISVKNGRLYCELPATPFDIRIDGTESQFDTPKNLQLKESNSRNITTLNGYHLNRDSGKSIKISSDYSEVVLHQ